MLYLALYGTGKMQNIIDTSIGGNGCGVHVVITFMPAFSSKNNRSDSGSATASNF